MTPRRDDPPDRDSLRRGLDRFREDLERLDGVRRDDRADVAVFAKAVEWILTEEEFFGPSHEAMARKVLDVGRARLAALGGGHTPWRGANFGVVGGFFSDVDGSVQPYAVYVPEAYDGRESARLDVILHGRDARLNEVAFLHAHDGRPYPEGESGLLLHVFGRGNNAYRWAGEADVFEAIRAAMRRYRVDPNRVLLRGFSMGGAGAWHLGLYHPAEWCAVEAGAGFTETRRYARLDDLPPREVDALHIYDAADYALNATNLAVAGYGGEDDEQLEASRNIVRALADAGIMMDTDGLVTRARGLDFLHVVGAETGHRVDAESEAILKEFRDRHAAKGHLARPERVRFVTYTLAFHRAPRFSVEGLREHYRRATVDASIEGDAVVVAEAENVALLAVDREAGGSIRLGDEVFPLRSAAGGFLPQVYFRRVEAGWLALDYEQSREHQLNARRRKVPGLQGPIDHAFAGPFLCVRGTGRAWNPSVKSWAEARLDRFAREWRRHMRGELPVKDDADVDDEDMEGRHLVLFGDPGSNRLIERVVGSLPVRWGREEVAIGDGPATPASDHVPALIAPNPLNPLRYVVLNSGHTFGAEAFEGTNALLYPRLGDHAILRVRDRGEEVVASGYFDEAWRPRPAEGEVSLPGRRSI